MKKVKISLLCVLVLAILATSVTVFAIPRLPSGPTFKEVKIATVQDAGKNFDLRANVYLPVNDSPAPIPLLLYVHGNGGAYNFSGNSRSYELTIALADRGIAVAVIDYRPVSNFPENIYDVKAYVRYFRAHAKEYNIDPNRIGVWGGSRGGHLAAMLATTGDMKEFEGDIGGNLEQSSKIQAAVILYPMTDALSQREKFPFFSFGAKAEDVPAILEADAKNDTSSPVWKYVELARLVNPLKYVSPDDCPAFISTGAKDAATSLFLGWNLYNKYIETGVDATFHSWSKGTHGIIGPFIEAAAQEWILDKLLHMGAN